jgi:hypothetical protein
LLEGWFGRRFLFLIERGRKAKRIIKRGEERLVEEEFDGRDAGVRECRGRYNSGSGSATMADNRPAEGGGVAAED